MPASGVSRAAKIRQERRDSLRELLRQQGHEQHVLVMLDKLQNLDSEIDQLTISRLSKAIDTRMKLIAKYLPDDKEPQDFNVGGQEDNPIIQEIRRTIVSS
jgi:hypothetical protein